MTVNDHDQLPDGWHGDKESIDAQLEARPDPQSIRRWRLSPERKAIRTTGIICLIAVLLPAVIAAAVLAERQQSLAQAANSADLAVIQAQNAFRERAAIANDDRIELVKAQDRGAPKAQLVPLQAQAKLSTSQAQEALDNFNRDQIAVISAKSRSGKTSGMWLLYSGAVVAGIILAVLIFFYVRGEKLRSYESNQILDNLKESERAENPFDLTVLWNNNRDQLASYHKLILNYASSTRQATIATLLVGFSFFVIIGIFAFFARNTPAAVAASVVATVGATVTGFIGNGVLRNAETSSREVLAFFSHPLDVQRALSAERVINTMPESSREEARLLLVRALTQARTYDGSVGKSQST